MFNNLYEFIVELTLFVLAGVLLISVAYIPITIVSSINYTPQYVQLRHNCIKSGGKLIEAQPDDSFTFHRTFVCTDDKLKTRAENGKHE